MTKFDTNIFRNNFFAILCTILFSSTVLLSATAPAIAGEVAQTNPSVAAPLA